jgi:hypothetical protein
MNAVTAPKIRDMIAEKHQFRFLTDFDWFMPGQFLD